MKILITGKGRCNITNDCDIEELIEKLVKGVLFGSIEKTDEKTYKENDNE